jgi:hypothetical protein
METSTQLSILIYVVSLHYGRHTMNQLYPDVAGKFGSFLQGLICCILFLMSWHDIFLPLLLTFCYFLYDTFASLVYFKSGMTRDIAIHHFLGGFLCAVALYYKSYETTSNVYDITSALLRMEITNVPLQGFQVVNYVLKQENCTLNVYTKVLLYSTILGSWCKFRLWDLVNALVLTFQLDTKGWEVVCALCMGWILFVQQVYWLFLLLRAATK